ncbi:hypothetical protein [Escherichia coli]|uniref:hypothetical protein n=1 Tax=Escherichia coli TaxID=562 RepID=UPI003988E4D9
MPPEKPGEDRADGAVSPTAGSEIATAPVIELDDMGDAVPGPPVTGAIDPLLSRSFDAIRTRGLAERWQTCLPYYREMDEFRA